MIKKERGYFLAGVDWVVEVGRSEKTERWELERERTMVRLTEVSMKTTADQVVRRVRRLEAPRGPKAVCEPEPPKAPARSADLPC